MKITVQAIQEKKRRGEKIVMLTSYDFPTACRENELGVDIQLVGDSVGVNVLGYADISQVTVDDMAHHVAAVGRGARNSFVLCDMPFGSFDSPAKALVNARHFCDRGADGVKMEGERPVLDNLRALAGEGIPVCAHIGYTPQTHGAHATVQGKSVDRARELIAVADELQNAGACMLVLELIPEILAAEITRRLRIPTIGIGAGRFCDGQVQVIYDIAGLTPTVFRHTRVFADVKPSLSDAISRYVTAVRGGAFPEEKNAPRLAPEVLQQLSQWLGSL